VRSKMLPSSL